MKDLIQKEEVIKILKKCFDPELPVDLWNLGLIYDIKIQEAYDETKSDINIIMSYKGKQLMTLTWKFITQLELSRK